MVDRHPKIFGKCSFINEFSKSSFVHSIGRIF